MSNKTLEPLGDVRYLGLDVSALSGEIDFAHRARKRPRGGVHPRQRRGRLRRPQLRRQLHIRP